MKVIVPSKNICAITSERGIITLFLLNGFGVEINNYHRAQEIMDDISNSIKSGSIVELEYGKIVDPETLQNENSKY